MNMRVLKDNLCIISLVLFGLSACSHENDGAEILTYDIIDSEDDTEIDKINKEINILFPGETLSAEDLTSEFTLSEGALAFVDDILQESGLSVNDYGHPFTVHVISENEENEINWKVTSSNNTYTGGWGLGWFQSYSAASNRTYEWYIDQFYTGQHSAYNCGPASTTMVAKWSQPVFSKTAAEARSAYRPEGGWWYTNDIGNYLADNDIPYSVINLGSSSSSTEQIISAEADKGHVMILCLDMFYVRSGSNGNKRVDRFYPASTAGWGHFIVVKGYRNVDGKLYFEVYDPYCNGLIYGDGSLKGKDRYYRSEDIYSATSVWWNYAIVVTPWGEKSYSIQGPEPATIPAQWGR
jgi:hypothetical protein